MNAITLQNVTKNFGEVTAVDRLDLEIREGEFLTLLGPSGCGKTTTLRMIAGLEDPNDGEISTKDRILYSKAKGVYIPPEQREMGFMFQSYALWPHMNVSKNISLGLETKKLSREEVNSRVHNVLDQVQMKGYETRYPSELSGGQQQRVALARMIASETGIFLMDEPLSNLDALLRVDMRSELKHLHQTLGATTVYVTHDQMEALTLSDRIVVMNKGRIMQFDTPAEIYHRPKNLFVAKFVGSPPINLISGYIKKRDASKVFLENKDISIDVSSSATALSLADGTEVILAIRPENIRIGSPVQGKPSVPGTVYAVLPSGSETIITARRGESEMRVKVSGFVEYVIDDEIHLEFDSNSILFFDSTTEELITH
ncbi:MAG: ABC transporter ATP-binding protein [Sphaerochaetaceae bacterium]|nr:ABC transporter ATP-binding protein [Sphaerochaetaceae bacterium]